MNLSDEITVAALIADAHQESAPNEREVAMRMELDRKDSGGFHARLMQLGYTATIQILSEELDAEHNNVAHLGGELTATRRSVRFWRIAWLVTAAAGLVGWVKLAVVWGWME